MEISSTIPVPFKKTTQLDLGAQLLKHVEDKNRHQWICEDLQERRTEICSLQADHINPLAKTYQYYGRLINFTRTLKKDLDVKFSWRDAFTGKLITHSKLAFEFISLLYNLAVSLSESARSKIIHNDIDEALEYFLASAGVFAYINDNFRYAPSDDLRRGTIGALKKIMQAQAVEALLRRDSSMGLGPGLLASRAAAAANLYREAVNEIKNDSTITEIPKSWIQIVSAKRKMLKWLAQCYQAVELFYRDNCGADDVTEAFRHLHVHSSDRLGEGPKSFTTTPMPKIPVPKTRPQLINFMEKIMSAEGAVEAHQQQNNAARKATQFAGRDLAEGSRLATRKQSHPHPETKVPRPSSSRSTSTQCDTDSEATSCCEIEDEFNTIRIGMAK